MRREVQASAPGGAGRSIMLLLGTLVGMAALFGVYWALLQPPGRAAALLPEMDDLPDSGGDLGAVQVGSMEVPGGGAIELTTFDPHTGRPRESFRCETYSLVPGSRNEIHVTKPEISLRLPSGMIATISSEIGQIRVDRVDSNRGRPNDGWLEGDARIVIDRETSTDRAPAAERPHDLIVIESQRLVFDLVGGTLETSGDIRARGREFDIQGTGLRLAWNADENRVEELTIERGRELLLRVADGGMFGAAPIATAGAPQAETTSGTAEVAVAAASAPAAAARPARDRARRSGYECLLLDGVVAEQWSNGQLSGGLEANQLRLRFDEGGDAEAMLAGDRERGASSRPAELDDRNKLVVRWNGPLKLTPTAPRARGASGPVRQVEAIGDRVVLRTPDGEIRCGGLRFNDGEQRVWLSPLADGRVQVDFKNELQASAASVYLAIDENRLKLVGDVRIDSRGARDSSDRMRISCSHWADLHLRAQEGGRRPVGAEGLAENDIERAVFVGGAEVRVGARRLSADQIEATFAAPRSAQDFVGPPATEAAVAAAPASSLEDRLEWLLATGGARLIDDGQTLEAGWVRVEFQAGVDGRAAPRSVLAEGAVRLRGERGEFAAVGRRLTADLAVDRPLEQALRRAVVTGAPGQTAAVRAQGYRVRGAQVELEDVDLGAGTLLLRVPGDSDLRFASRRGLRGVERARSMTTHVRATRLLAVDLRPGRNLVELVGGVDARDGEEQLLADALTIELADAAPPHEDAGHEVARGQLGGETWLAAAGVARAATQNWERWQRQMRGLAAPEPAARVRIAAKEPQRAAARNAVVLSETFAPGDPQPLVHQSIVAPEMELLIRERKIVTHGETRMYLTSRRMDDDGSLARDVAGVPSAMLTRGPSQTVLRAANRMTYTIGPEEPSPRSDSIVLEGGVRMRHVAGREMVNIEQMLPQVARDPALLDRLTPRNTYLEADRLEGTLVAGGDAADRQAALQMHRLTALGSVFLRDQVGDSLRSLEAARVEFDRIESIARVFGDSTADARIFNENRATRQSDTPFVGPEAVIDLKTNTLRTRRVTGQLSGGN